MGHQTSRKISEKKSSGYVLCSLDPQPEKFRERPSVFLSKSEKDERIFLSLKHFFSHQILLG